MILIVSFADVEIEEVAMSLQKMSGATRDGLIVFAAVLGVTLILALWAAFIRKKKRRSSRHLSHEHAAERVESADPDGSKKRKWRRRRREHRPRNPTLAETGGLPPVRPPEGPDA